MLINAHIVSDYSKILLKHRVLSNRCDPLLEYPKRYTEGEALLSNILYLLDETQAEKIHTKQKRGCFLILGHPSQNLLDTNLDILYTDTNAIESDQMMNELIRIFSCFQNFENTLYRNVYTADAIQEICNCALDFLRNPIGIYTTSFQLITYAERKKPLPFMLFHPEDRYSFSTDEEVANLTMHPDFEKSLKFLSPMVFPSDLTSYRILYQNIRVEGKNVARIVACETDSPLRESDFLIMDTVTHVLNIAFKFSHAYIHLTRHARMNHLIDCLLDKSNTLKDDLNTLLENYGWKWNDHYIVYCIKPELDNATESTYNTCIRLENQIEKSLSREVDGHILYLVNLTYAKLTYDDVASRIVLQIRDFFMKAGISNEFSNLHELHMYYQQAHMALYIGEKSRKTIWSYRFSDYAVPYMMDKLLADMPFDFFCIPALKTLMEYDQKKSKNYTHVLRVYLENNMNIAKTVSQLYLHRQTFLYQLDIIKNIIGINLDDKDVRFYLQISYKMMDAANITYRKLH